MSASKNPTGRSPGSDVAAADLRVADYLEGAARQYADDLRFLPIGVLFPVGRWLHDRPWDQPWVRGLIFLALCPLAVAAFLGPGAQLSDIVWMLGAYFALIWGVVFHRILKPGRVSVKAGIIVCSLTLIAGAPLAALIEGGSATKDLAGSSVLAGAVEEFVKSLPVMWLVFKSSMVRSPREAAFLAALSGLAFGVAEAVVYSYRFAIGNYVGVLPYSSYVALQLARLISAPFLHALWASIAGYYIAVAATYQTRVAAVVTFGLVLAGVMHFLYDYALAASQPLVALVIAGGSILIVVGYAANADEIAVAYGESAPSLRRRETVGTVKQLRRSRSHRVLGGVAGGTAEYFGAPVWVARVAWIATVVITGGLTLPVYAAMWALVPQVSSNDRDRVKPSDAADAPDLH